MRKLKLAALLAVFFTAALAAETAKTVPVPGLLAAVGKRALEIAPDRKIRLAVLPLKPTGSPRYTDKGFGDYLTEKLSSSLAAAGPKIRLFERTLLDTVMKEQALSAGGLIDKTEAMKIGELAPIDYILTGTFTRLDSSIAVNLRFIDVVSGEVKGDISENLELTGDLAALFADAQAPAAPGEEEPPSCDGTWAPVKALMQDVGTQAKVDKLVDAAAAVPFEPPCGEVHFGVMDLLSRYKLNSARYNDFLLKTLQKIDNPDADDRAPDIAGYLLAAPQPDPKVWNEALRAAGLSRHFYGYQDMLLGGFDGSDASGERLRERFGTIMAKAERKELGRPVPLEPGKVFLDLLQALSSRYMGAYEKKDPRPLLDCYQAYGTKYAGGAGTDLLKVLAEMHDTADDLKDRARALDWFCARVGALEPSRELADITVDFMRKLFDARKEALKKDPSGGAPAAELKRMAALCGGRIGVLIPFIVGRDYRLDVTAFCLENGITGPAVPGPASLAKDLSSGDSTARTEAIRLLKPLGPAALPAEPAAIRLLRRSDDQYLQHDLVGLLGAIRTASPEAHKLMIEQLLSQESYVADEAITALAAVGAPAAEALKAEFPKIEESYKKVRVLKVFELRGKAAAKDLPWLKSALESAPDKYVRNAAEDAVDAVSGN